MSYADRKFKEMCSHILENGESSVGQTVRPKWEDGEPAHTISVFSHISEYDLAKGFPALTLRPTAIKSAIDEVLWIWQKKSNNIRDLKSNIWDLWADSEGSIGKAYGYQLGKKYKFPQGEMDQVDDILWQLKNTPASRRMITNIYNHEDLHEMGLSPCCYSCTFGVKNGELNMILNQRSQDTLVANNWNVVQYAALLMMLAQVSGLTAGKMTHVIADAHIYDRHIPIVKDLITRMELDAPLVLLDPDVTNFYDFTTNSFQISKYRTGEQITNIPVAI